MKTYQTTALYQTITAELETRKPRSAWGRGVLQYAFELAESLSEAAEYYGRNPDTVQECKTWLYNGADSWSAYSWGGSSLIYDSDIAERLCTPSELKRTRNGDRRPNSSEEWLDTQARALTQAARIILNIYRLILSDAQ